MKLDRLILINWGQLLAGDYSVGDLTLLTGETGAGKSTMLDGLQTVMTACHTGIFNYNPGQDELVQGQRRGKTKRTLESYVVGAEYSKFSRPDGAHGYMAAVFKPSKGEEGLAPFTALICASARVDGTGEARQARLETLALVIIDGAELTSDDFLISSDSTERVAVDHIVRHLRSKYSGTQDYNEKKKDYLCALYGRFRGRSSVTFEEASNAAKAWVQSIAYQPIGSVHELVRDEILDFDGKMLQQDILSISGLMRQVTNLRKESLRLAASIARLNSLKNAAAETANAHELHVLNELLLAKLSIKIDTDTVKTKSELIRVEGIAKERELEKIASWEARVDGLDVQRIALHARLLGIAAHVQKQDIDAKLISATSTARLALKELSQSLAAAGLLERQAQSLIEMSVPKELLLLKSSVSLVAQELERAQLPILAECLQIVLSVSTDDDLNVEQIYNLVQAFRNISGGVGQLYSAMVGTQGSVLVAAIDEASTLNSRKIAASALVRDLGSSKASLAEGKAPYPPKVKFALECMQEQYPAANAQVLCDLIDPRSEDWQAAIEGYIGGNRFNIIVNEEWEERALDFVRDRKLGISLIQGALCLKNASSKILHPDSIVHELKSANPIAWAYLVDQYGTVLKVADAHGVRSTARALTKDGRGSGGRTMFAVEMKELVFGKKARIDALNRVERALKIAEEDASSIANMAQMVSAARNLLTGLREPTFEVSSLGKTAGEIEQLRASLATLDLTQSKEISDQAERLVKEIDQFKFHISASNKQIYALDSSIRSANAVISAVEANRSSRLDALSQETARVKRLAEENPQLTYPVLVAQVAEWLDDPEITFDGARMKCAELLLRPDQLLGDVRLLLLEHNGQARSDERFIDNFPHRLDTTHFDIFYKPLVDLKRLIGLQLDDFQGFGLYNNHSELARAENSFHEVFTTQFCVAIKSKVEDGIRTLRQINNELRNLKFGSDSFSIDWSKWEPEFEEYLSFFEAVTEMAGSGDSVDLFAENALSNKHILIRDRLVKLLLDDDQERATKELMRIADYRNYRRYDIWSDSGPNGRIALSTWGTGSGGQLETPAYIVRAAIVTNRLKMFEKGPSLKLLVNDESFSKMDERRARAVLEYLRDSLDLQVISAMPTMKAGGLRDEFNREYSFSRVAPVLNGELDFMSECDERIYQPDKMREVWEQHRQEIKKQTKLDFDARTPFQDEQSTDLDGKSDGSLSKSEDLDGKVHGPENNSDDSDGNAVGPVSKADDPEGRGDKAPNDGGVE